MNIKDPSPIQLPLVTASIQPSEYPLTVSASHPLTATERENQSIPAAFRVKVYTLNVGVHRRRRCLCSFLSIQVILRESVLKCAVLKWQDFIKTRKYSSREANGQLAECAGRWTVGGSWSSWREPTQQPWAAGSLQSLAGLFF